MEPDRFRRAFGSPEPSERRLRALTNQVPVGIFETDMLGNCLYVNDRWTEMTGMTREAARGTGWAGALHPDDRERVFGEWREATEGAPFASEYRFLAPDGRVSWVIGSAVALHDEEGGATGYLGSCFDLTERRRSEAARREADNRFAAAFDGAAVGMAITSVLPETMGRFLKVNRALCEMTGYTELELLEKSFADVTHPDDIELNLGQMHRLLSGESDRVEFEKRYLRADRETRWVQVNAALVRDADGRPIHSIGQILDISERKRLEERLLYLAGHDQMTGLFNRHRFEEELERQLAYSRRHRVQGVLLLADLDGFKDVNDSLGHHAGDELLKTLAETIRRGLREIDLIGRLGGDEFVVFLPHTDLAGGETVAQSLVDRIRGTTVPLGGYAVETTASAGVARFDPLGDESVASLLMHADRAMYQAKASGGDRFVVFSERLVDLRPDARWRSADGRAA